MTSNTADLIAALASRLTEGLPVAFDQMSSFQLDALASATIVRRATSPKDVAWNRVVRGASAQRHFEAFGF